MDIGVASTRMIESCIDILSSGLIIIVPTNRWYLLCADARNEVACCVAGLLGPFRDVTPDRSSRLAADTPVPSNTGPGVVASCSNGTASTDVAPEGTVRCQPGSVSGCRPLWGCRRVMS